MLTSEGIQFMDAMTYRPGRGQLVIVARAACSCGCGKPKRIEFTIGDNTIMVDDPVAIRAAISTLEEALAKLWKEAPCATKHNPSTSSV
jgi:hypothetical protein